MAAVTSAVAVGVAAAATVYQADQARKQRKDAKKNIQKQEDEANRQAKELEANQKNEEARSSAVKDRKQKISRQKALRSDSQQKGGTLLTGPGGVEQANNSLGQSGGEGIKTLLGV